MPVYVMRAWQLDWKQCIRYLDCDGWFEQVFQKRKYEIVEDDGTAPLLDIRMLQKSLFNLKHLSSFFIYSGDIRKTSRSKKIANREIRSPYVFKQELRMKDTHDLPCYMMGISHCSHDDRSNHEHLQTNTPWNATWWFQICFLFSALLGEMIQFDEHIFQMGWFNQQPELNLPQITPYLKPKKHYPRPTLQRSHSLHHFEPRKRNITLTFHWILVV